MTVDFISLAIIATIAALVPLVARAIPGRIIPETVLLLVAGAVFGPYWLNLVSVDTTISFISDLGLAFLFLLAGYEIDPKKIVGRQGLHGLATWVVTLAIAALIIWMSDIVALGSIEGIVLAVAMTTTALGTLLPILKERNLTGTPIGDGVLAYGTWGELGPVITMAFLLTTRSTVASAAVLLIMIAICVLMVVFARVIRKYSNTIFKWITEGAHTSSQTYVRFTVLLLVLLLAAVSCFELDIVLGAFAAGFVLRRIVPDDNETLETKLDGMAHGFFIPLFFVVSGANIDIAAIGTNPLMLIVFIALLLLVRGVPIFASLNIVKESRALSIAQKASVSLYCTTALPLIVALTSVATKANAMSTEVASVLVAAGAVTVFVMPLLALFSHRKL